MPGGPAPQRRKRQRARSREARAPMVTCHCKKRSDEATPSIPAGLPRFPRDAREPRNDNGKGRDCHGSLAVLGNLAMTRGRGGIATVPSRCSGTSQ